MIKIFDVLFLEFIQSIVVRTVIANVINSVRINAVNEIETI